MTTCKVRTRLKFVTIWKRIAPSIQFTLQVFVTNINQTEEDERRES